MLAQPGSGAEIAQTCADHRQEQPRDEARHGRGASNWTSILAQYRKPNALRSVLELTGTAACFVVLWALTAIAIENGIWAGLLLTIPAAAFLVRLFVLQHDCGHGSLFTNRMANDWTGRVIGILTLTPYDYWRRTHAVHHASAGNLDRRGIGDITTLTVREYRALSPLARLQYRLYRHPLVMFGLGPAWLFVVQHRLPLGLMRAGVLPWMSAIGTTIGILLPAGILIWMLGLGTFLVVQLPITLMAATAGVWLFFVQHQFEETSWWSGSQWNFHDAALHGSSHYDLPPVLRWFSGNIGIHHVHHLSATIPFYRLPDVLRDHPELHDMGRITLLSSLKTVRLALWDEDARRLISFREAELAAGA